MRFRPSWLRRVLQAPVVPTLGPVHPDTLGPEIFDDVVAVAHTGEILPFDKERRWSAAKSESVLVDEIVHRPDLTILPTLSHRGTGMIKIHVYSPATPDIAALRQATRRWCAGHGAASGRLLWFTAEPPQTDAGVTRILLKDFVSAPLSIPAEAVELDACPPRVQDTFADLAEQLLDTGFGFLHRRWRTGRVDGPILVAVDDDVIVGAIGPLTVMPDRAGTLTLLPQYFGVAPRHRGRGHGRALWRSGSAWGARHGARYQLLQAAVRGPSERLFRSEGLTTLGFTCAVSA
ncbi:GNAT family N-acetyltransferase [Amycolatopsis eburnea]|uniref:GNAT family N-acetyltransferase n=1 Tax=Amycolatopsis eburnea TaxID=2267691 RepID=A0A3R9DY12_9PSEU|nr:GNAT family N-acetyltransferase [Amycolatopsis eburnea]RSD10272.1 GNAT family N-acetyltransferase [Amycolatopsis eburnea]